MTARVVGAAMALTLAVSAQTVSVGVKVGSLVTPLLTTERPVSRTEMHRLTVGPAVELSLPRRVGIEAALLYKRLGGAGRWELPAVLRYRFTGQRVRPFAVAGVSSNRVMGASQRGEAELRHRSTHGFVAGTGTEARLGNLRVAAEFRVTRWVDRNFGVRDAAARSNLTQAELLAGLMF